jgi:glucose-6-phosphate isomerase
VRVLHLKTLDEAAMGALMMHLALETIISGELMGVDPYSQPAVEESKRLARAFLEGSA